MSATARRHICADPPGCQLPAADRLLEDHPGYRVEILSGIITVTPLPDGGHAQVLTDLMLPFLAHWPGDDDPQVLQGLGLRGEAEQHRQHGAGERREMEAEEAKWRNRVR